MWWVLPRSPEFLLFGTAFTPHTEGFRKENKQLINLIFSPPTFVSLFYLDFARSNTQPHTATRNLAACCNRKMLRTAIAVDRSVREGGTKDILLAACRSYHLAAESLHLSLLELLLHFRLTTVLFFSCSAVQRSKITDWFTHMYSLYVSATIYSGGASA